MHIKNYNLTKFYISNSSVGETLKYITQFEDGYLSKIKTSTLFPESWSDKSIIDSVNKIGNTKPIGVRPSTGETLHRGTVNGVEIDVIKKGNNITAAYPIGG
ncbi:EndoU domain-containing protein [Gilliamella sp. App4-10]|uniref:EndoU domain-containing protein n=1 Tax=Gilliamella sp. App4-10 TaxID=3120231 RepID=UPI00159EE867|nr:EndoU domain-containing protein [Gilliamella apicola]